MERNIMLILGIFVLCSFFAFSAISFFKHRLPKKRREYRRLRRALATEIEQKERLDQFDEDRLINELVQNDFRGWDYVLPVFFVTLFCALGFWVLFSTQPPLILAGISRDGISIGPESLSYSQLSLLAIGMSILGSYIWSIQYIVRRLINLDLAPGAYYSIGTRIIFACFLSVIMHHYFQSLDAALKKDFIEALPVIAFFVGIFPQRALQYLQEKVFFLKRPRVKAHKLPLEMIEGVNLFSRVRLSEIGIDNAQNLATANFVELILRTPFNPLLLLDWMAQAKLYLTAKDDIEALRKANIRNAFDMLTLNDPQMLKIVSGLSGISEDQLTLICQVLSDDPKIVSLLSMREQLGKGGFYLNAVDNDGEGDEDCEPAGR